jgi:hypothetical protein
MSEQDTTAAMEEAPKEPGTAKPWLKLITDAEKRFATWQDKCDNVEKQYANMERLASTARDRQFQIFWANIEVVKPAIYARPPIPVVTPRFKDRKPLNRAAAEVLERSSLTSFDHMDIDHTMRNLRDDLALVSRASPWLRFDDREGMQKVIAEHVDRKDFLHGEGRHWGEVGWVARRGYYTKEEGMERFGEVFKEATLKFSKEENEASDAKGEKKAPVWEMWHKDSHRVYWLSPDAEHIFDEQEPYLRLEGFYPCPRPAYGTLQRGTLIPVPDFLFYKDQVEEINEITDRIAALTQSLQLRGFYPAGASEVGDAIEIAMKQQANNTVLIPIANWAALGGTAAKDIILWLPVDMVAKTITDLIALRKVLIDNVYEISGVSDIMRGDTEANETLGAQQLKSQYGSARIRDKTEELVRLARDITRIAAEIMAENFSVETFALISQTDLRRMEAVQQEAQQIQQQLEQMQMQAKQVMQSPEAQAMAQQNPEQAQQIMQQGQQMMEQGQAKLQQLGQEITLDAVVQMFQQQRLRPFVLDIETDSTIQPDENAAKQRATEFITAVGGFMGQAFPLVQQVPQAAPLASEMLKYVASQFRAGRELAGVIEEFADQMKQAASQQKPDPAQMQAQADAQQKQAQLQADMQGKQAELSFKDKEHTDKMALEAKKHEDEMSMRRDEVHYTRAMQMDERGKADAEASFNAVVEHEKRQGESERFNQELKAKDREAMTGAGMPPDYSFEKDREMMTALLSDSAETRETVTEAMLKVTEQSEAMVQGLAQVAAVMAAPKRIVKDSAGRPAGIEIDKSSVN